MRSLGFRFYGSLLVLSFLGVVAFGALVARRTGNEFAGRARAEAERTEDELRDGFSVSADSQAELMDRAVRHLSENLGKELEDIPFDVFEGRDDLLLAYLKERLGAARDRNAENSRVIAEIFRERAGEDLEGALDRYRARQEEASVDLATSVFRGMLLWGGLLLTLTMAATGIVFWRLVLTPLGRATESIDRFAGGDATARVPVAGGDEMARLATSFNGMADEIAGHRADLERRVEQKTAELTRSLDTEARTNERLRATLGELETTQAQLVESGKLAALGTMARGMAHEFNNILGGIGGCASELLAESRSDDDRELLEVIVRTAKRAGVITDNLLRFGRAGPREIEDTDVGEVVRTAAVLVETEASGKNVLVDVSSVEPRSARSDPRGLQQVFLNLLINAVHACDDGGRVAVTMASTPTGCDVTVADDGAGISASDLERVFEPFFTTKEDAGPGEPSGTGLGLSVARGVMEQLGGTIHVTSGGPGQGASFIVRIPNEAPAA